MSLTRFRTLLAACAWALALLPSFTSAQPPSAERPALARLLASLADGKAEAAQIAIRELLRRPRLHEAEAHELRRLDASLQTQLEQGVLDELAWARARGDVATLSRWIQSTRSPTQLKHWLCIERALALDRDGVRKSERAAARSAIRRWLAHPLTKARSLTPALTYVLAESEAERARLTDSSPKTAGKSTRRPRPQGSPSIEELRARARTWASLLACGRTPFPPPIVQQTALENALRRIRSATSKQQNRIVELDRRNARLRSQIKRMSDPERRDAKSNLGRIQADIRRNKSAIGRAKLRLRELRDESKRYEALALSDSLKPS